jgi:hypothetical protein
MGESLHGLFHAARTALGETAVGMAPIIGMSRRTALRYSAGRSSPGVHSLDAMARAVLPIDADLAARIYAAAVDGARAIGITLEPLPSTTPEPAPVDPHAIDTVLCAVADAMALPPRSVRAGLLAGLRRARDAGLGVDAMIAALEAGAQKKAQKKGKARVSASR